ncbi:MAG: hypothetical protein ACLSTO_02440 [Bilophila wadsworthia]
MKNALIPVVTLAGKIQPGVRRGRARGSGIQLARHGAARLRVHPAQDYPALLGILFCSVFVVIANVLTDFAYRFLIPK